jgi:peptide/nickel transport system permease protein
MSYVRNRLIQAATTFYLIVTLGFLLTKLMPGGPVEYVMRQIQLNPRRYGLPENPTPQQVIERVEELVAVPPDRPIHEAYVNYMYNVFVELNLGESIVVARGVPVMELILARAPWTIFISSIGLLYGLIIGIILGSMMAYYEGSKFDIGTTVSMILNNAVPYYLAAIFLLYFLAFQNGWFPDGGHYNPDATPGINWPFISSVFYYAALPALSFIITGFGGPALGIRANAIRLLGSDHMYVARLRGLSSYRIATSYLARNAVLPLYTSIVIGLGSLLGGSVILEQIFQYPGMGLLMFEATVARDFPVLMGALFLTSFIFIIGTLIADFTYSLIDPRADVTASRGGG